MSLGCKDALGGMSDYVDGELAAELKAEFDRHLGQCAFCRAQLESCRKTINLLKKANDVQPDQDMVRRVIQFVSAHLSKS